MNGEQKIIVSGGIIIVFGTLKAALTKKPLDVPIVGGVVLVLLLSLVSAFGSAWSELAGNFALLALVAVLLVSGPEVLKAISSQVPAGINLGQPTSSFGH